MSGEIVPGAGRMSFWRSPLRAVIVLCVLGLGFWVYARTTGHIDGFGSPTAHRLAPSLNLTSDVGRPFHLKHLKGDVVLVYFGYTHCPDVCPMTLSALARTMRDLGLTASKVKIVFVTLDPQHDTPTLLRQYLKAFNPAFIGLTGSPDAIAKAARNWNITWHRVSGHADYIDHTSVVTLIGPQGYERFKYGITQIGHPGAIASDIKRILKVG